MMDDSLVALLSGWKVLGAQIGTLTEEQSLDLLNYELLTKRRKNIVERLHMRHSSLRVKREREELLRTL